MVEVHYWVHYLIHNKITHKIMMDLTTLCMGLFKIVFIAHVSNPHFFLKCTTMSLNSSQDSPPEG